jgi:hypothetical protein
MNQFCMILKRKTTASFSKLVNFRVFVLSLSFFLNLLVYKLLGELLSVFEINLSLYFIFLLV